jgi:hypothetical protein
MSHDIMMYSIVQKDGLGLDKAIEEVKYRMSRYQVTPNMLVVPPQVKLRVPSTIQSNRRDTCSDFATTTLTHHSVSRISQLLLYMATAPDEKIKL